VSPTNESLLRCPASLHGVRPSGVPPLRRYHQDTTTPVLRPARLGCPRQPVPPVGAVFAPAPPHHAGSGLEVSGAGFLLPAHTDGDDRFSHVPRGPHRAFALLSDPGGTKDARPLRRLSMAPANSTAKAPASILSRLNHTASALVVYASRRRSPARRARLTSGRWPSATGWDWIPTGSQRKVSELRHRALFPLS